MKTTLHVRQLNGCETSVKAKTSHFAVCGTRQVAMTTGERSESQTQAWSVDIPVLSVMRRRNRPGSGWRNKMRSNRVGVKHICVMHGLSWNQGNDTASAEHGRRRCMGLASHTGYLRGGQTGCESTEWASETSVRCLLGHGSAGTRASVMTVGQRIGSVGDIGQVSSCAWIVGHSAGVNDGRSPGSKYDARLVSQRGRGELEQSSEQSRDGMGVGDCCICWRTHLGRTHGAHGNRGDEVDIRHTAGVSSGGHLLVTFRRGDGDLSTTFTDISRFFYRDAYAFRILSIKESNSHWL